MTSISELNLNENCVPQSDQPLSNDSSQQQQQQQLQHQPTPPAIFLYSDMGTPSQEDLIGNIGSCDPLFSAQSDEQIDIGEPIIFLVDFVYLRMSL